MKNITTVLLFLLMLSCESDDSLSSADFGGSESRGGSTATFAVRGDYLYVVDSQNMMVFDTSDENDSRLVNTISVGWGVETIFPFQNLLLLGTQTGVFIYDASTPTNPVFLSNYEHIVACDPVVTDGRYAFLTLRDGTACRQAVNELQVIDMTNVTNPTLIAQYGLTNPKGLALNGNTLYVCDDGIKIFDVTDKFNPVETGHISGFNANDVIFHRNQLLVTAEEGFYQFDASTNTQLSYFTYIR